MKAYNAYIKSALASGYHIRVDLLEDEVIDCKGSFKKANEAVKLVDQGAILVVSQEPNEHGRYTLYGVAYYLLQDGPDEEYIYDYTVTRWNERFFKKYYDDPTFHGAVSLTDEA